MRFAAAASVALVGLTVTPAAADVSFRFPGSDEHREFYYITAYRDLTGTGGGLEDWGCGDDTYDGHRGTDMGVGGFPGMDEGRDVVAAAGGVVSFVNDGVFDRCTTGNCAGGGGFGNYVRIDHADGKVTYYGHLKKFSITVAVGDEVTCGQTIGQVGSSGSSTGPHLHFEPRVGEVSDDPFSGSCGGPISWWVDQGPYQGLPAPVCQDAGPVHPRLSMDARLEPIEGQEPDAHPGGDSEGVFDLEAGQSVTARFTVTAAAAAAKAPDVVLGVEAPGGFVEVTGWEVLSDVSGGCGDEFCPNDANDHPMNPPRDDPGESLDFHLNALSPGETKVLALGLRYRAPTGGQAPHAPVRAWVVQVPGSYDKPTFDAEPDNVDAFQTFNGGDLRQALVIDTWAAPEDGDDPPTGENDAPDPPAPDVPGGEIEGTGGCGAAPGSGSGAPGAFLVLSLLWLRRHRTRAAG